ncbi:zinc finger HIT domain-containing protein 3-like isoform X2 [Mya arenaria]|uniref:zinc finger HIT domain-containing protein 3-like isoform X2 n=1 Tax=Mya arenaria TaxID=6604 RepID=UPI0022E97C9B|nr:zinc finger HIT domain-containing protein 3-like isoform X2 [Mya arenaria]
MKSVMGNATRHTMIKKATCQVCNEVEHKYRCPKCRIVYCSLDCYRTHKDCCIEKEPEKEVAQVLTQVDVSEVPDYHLGEDGSEDRVSLQQLQALEGSGELRVLLENPHLRQMMTSLVHSKVPGSLLEAAMQEPIFTEFADTCLSIVDDKNKVKLVDG